MDRTRRTITNHCFICNAVEDLPFTGTTCSKECARVWVVQQEMGALRAKLNLLVPATGQPEGRR